MRTPLFFCFSPLTKLGRSTILARVSKSPSFARMAASDRLFNEYLSWQRAAAGRPGCPRPRLHQLVSAAGAAAPLVSERGANATVTIAISTRGIPQITKLHRHEPSTSGSTIGMVSMTGTRFPDEQAVGVDRGRRGPRASGTKALDQWRQRRLHDRDLGAHHHGRGVQHRSMSEHTPRRPEPTPAISTPLASVGTAPKRAINSEPSAPRRRTG